MPTPEEFSYLLDEALVGRRRADREATEAERSRLEREGREKKENQVRQSQTAEEGERRMREEGQQIVEFAEGTQIRTKLGIIRDKISPKQEIITWGPENRNIAFSLSYRKRWSIIPVSFHRVLIHPGTSNKGGGTSPVYGTETDSGLRLVENVLAIRIDNQRTVGIFKKVCANSDSNHYEKDRNPLYWDYGRKIVSRDGLGYYVKEQSSDVLLRADLDSDVVMGQITQTLIDFYVGVKTGQGK